MTQEHWMLIGALAAGTYALRLIGYFAGVVIMQRPWARAVLMDLPGCLIVALVGVGLAEAPLAHWIAAGLVLAMISLAPRAVGSNVVVVMAVGVGAAAAAAALALTP